MCSTLGELMGMSFDISSVASLYRHLGGHAFLTRQVCSHIHNEKDYGSRPTTVRAEDVEEAVRAFNFDPLFSDILSSLQEHYPDEYQMLEWAALGEKDQVEYFHNLDRNFTSHLVGYGIVDSVEHQLHPRMHLLFDFLRRSASRSALVSNQTDRWAAIAKRRGELEVELRKVIKGRMIDKHGRAKAAEAVRSALTKRRQEELALCNLEDLFSPTLCKLYWSDLIALIKSQREYWAQRFDLDSTALLSLMADINNFRKDAHALRIEDHDFDRVMGAMDSMLAAI